MRRTPAWFIAIGLCAAWACWPSVGRAGVWLTLAAGVPGNSSPTSHDEFWFDTPHGPSQVAVSELTGGTTSEAVTGGGNVFFGGAGVPVLVNLSDGSAYLASGSAPAGARNSNPGGSGNGGGALSSTAPSAGGEIPSDAALLGINLAEPVDGTRTLSANVTDSLGNTLGTGSVEVPTGGWWVIGLTPGSNTPPVDPPPPTDPGPVDPPPPVDPGPIGGGDPEPPPPPPPPPTSPGDTPVATPEPSTLMLFALGGLTMRIMRRDRRKRAA